VTGEEPPDAPTELIRISETADDVAGNDVRALISGEPAEGTLAGELRTGAAEISGSGSDLRRALAADRNDSNEAIVDRISSSTESAEPDD
jgi:hypothetical protein